MQSVLNMKSVGSGMAALLEAFCKSHGLKSPVKKVYRVEERIPFSDWLQMLSEVDGQYAQEGLGLEIAKFCDVSHIGISAYIAETCGTIADYIALPRHYLTIWYDQIVADISVESNIISTVWAQSDYYWSGLYVRETDISTELKVAIIYRMILSMTGVSGPVFKKIYLSIKKPKNVRYYEEFFNTEIVFASRATELKIHGHLFHLPVGRKDPVLCELLKRQADSMLNKTSENITFIDLVNQAIFRAIKEQNPKVSVVASYLNMSTRSLQNLLKEHGLCFQELLSRVRMRLAKQYLLNGDISILEISNLLGYSEQTSFNRLFKNALGKSPVQWRSEELELK